MLARCFRLRKERGRGSLHRSERRTNPEHGATACGGEHPMINKIIEFSAKRKFLVFLLVGAAVLFGWQAMKNTKLDAIPDLSDTQVIVYSKWDRSPDIMEDQVTYP